MNQSEIVAAPTSGHQSDTVGVEDTDTPTVYWGVSSGASIKALRTATTEDTITDHDFTVDSSTYPTPSHAEISAATSNRSSLFPGPKWFIDSGGFSELHKSEDGTYSFSTEAYLDFLETQLENGIDIQYWALRDWPVTTDLLRAHSRSERCHQRWTVRDHWRCLDAAHERGLTSRDGTKPMAVLQGADTAGYLWMADHLRDQGLLTDHVCIGSLKQMSVHQVIAVAEAVRDALPSKHTLHGLGITKRHLHHPKVHDLFDSVDTTAWNRLTRRVPDRLSDVRHTWIGLLWAYATYRNQLAEQANSRPAAANNSGTQLFDFGGGRHTATGHTEQALSECICGATLDPNAVFDLFDDEVNTSGDDLEDALDSVGCRHCRHRLLTYAYQTID